MDTLRPRHRTPRIRVLPGGHLVIALTIVLGLVAAHTGQNVLAALVALVLAFQAVSGFRSSSVLKGLAVGVQAPRAVAVGDEAHAEVTIERRGRRRAAVSLELEAVVEGGGVRVAGAFVARVEAGSPVRVRVPVHGVARGPARIVEWRVSTAYPCDLFRRTLRYAVDQPVLVHPPRRGGRPPPRVGAAERVGAQRAALRDGGEVRGLRPWREGDAPRAIAWRPSARTGRLVVREEDGTAGRRVTVVLASDAVGAALEDDVSAAAAIVRAAHDDGRACELGIAGEAAPLPVVSRRTLDAALDALARYVPVAAPPPRPSVVGRTFLVGARAPAPAGARVERAPFAWLAPVAPGVPPPPAEVDARVRGRARADLAAWSLLTATAAGAALGGPLDVVPQALAAGAALAFGAQAERLNLGGVGRMLLLVACAAIAFVPGGGGASILLRFFAALAATLHLRRRTTGEDGFLLAVLLVQTALAAAMSSHALAAPVAVLAAVLAHRAIGSWHRMRAEERIARRAGAVVARADARPARRAADRAAVVALVVAVPIFAVLPRTEMPLLALPGVVSLAEPGVGDEVRLGGGGAVADGDEVVARAAPQDDVARAAEPYFRVLAYERFDEGVRWSTSHRDERKTRHYDAETGVLYPPGTAEGGANGRWAFSVDAGAGPRLPLPERAARVTFVDPRPDGVQVDDAGAIRPERHRATGRWAYDVVVGATSRRAADARPGDECLAPPPEPLATRLAAEIAPVVEEHREALDRARALTAWVEARCRYSLGVTLDRRDPLGDFLFRTRAGHCELFASALAVALRLAGIPSRVVGGYHGSRWNEMGGFWVLRRRDAHAWVEAWLGGGWTRFDATPAAARQADPYLGAMGALARLRDALVFAWNQHVVGFDADRQRDLAAIVRGAADASWRAVRALPIELAVTAGGLAGLIAAAMALRRWPLRRSPRPRRPAGPSPGPGAFYAGILQALARAGYPRRAAETPRALALRARSALPPGAGDALDAATQAFEGVRFGGAPPPDAAAVETWVRAVAAGGRAMRGRTIPAAPPAGHAAATSA